MNSIVSTPLNEAYIGQVMRYGIFRRMNYDEEKGLYSTVSAGQANVRTYSCLLQSSIKKSFKTLLRSKRTMFGAYSCRI